MNHEHSFSIRSWARQSSAVALSLMLLLYTQGQLSAQDEVQGQYAALDAGQLEQLVAPIALYPDSLVSQILAASTYPQQVSDAWNWTAQNGGMPPGARAAAIDAMPWDPAVKAVAEFPAAVEYMGRNPDWTGALGNAYYNQPNDVMSAIQSMRGRARAAGNLRTTAYERVYMDGPEILIAPVNPALVYVPYYDPWAVYGAPVQAWYGFHLLGAPRGLVWGTGIAVGFAAAVSIGLYAHYGWGWHAWSPNWHSGRVYYNHATYFSRSRTVYNRGHFGERNRGFYEHDRRGGPGEFHPGGHGEHAGFTGERREGIHQAGGYHPARAEAYHPGGPGAYHHESAPVHGAYHPGSPGAYHRESVPVHGAYHPGSPGAYHRESAPVHSAYHPSPATARPASHGGFTSAVGHAGHAMEHAGGPVHAAAAAHAPSGGAPHAGPAHVPEGGHGHK